jgi:stress response protein YsnF
VIETPVEEQVTLHQERVDIERRPVDRPVGPGDEAFRERVIEATETSEEAVVSKEARIREEVVVRKEAEERTETVRDTVRRTEVEIEDEKGRTHPASADTTKRDDSV